MCKINGTRRISTRLTPVLVVVLVQNQSELTWAWWATLNQKGGAEGLV